MLKKVLKITGIALMLIAASLFAIPYFFKDQIKAKISETINKKLDAKVSFSDADLSLFKNFPQATLSLDQLLVINKAPFEGDTLVMLEELNLKMSVKELFKGDAEPMAIEGIHSKNGYINILINKEGLANYDIALKDDKPQKEDKSKPMSFKIQQYEIENFKFKYSDQASQMRLRIDSLNHEGRGDFTNSKLDLQTKSSAKVSFDMGKINYMNKLALNLDAVLAIDLEQSKYTFKENKALINQLPLEFDGYIQMEDKAQLYDLRFKTPTSSFKNFLAVIPQHYASSLEGVKTTGDFSVNGFAKGRLTDSSIPQFKLEIASNNASFQYPNLPKSVQNIVIDTKIINQTGIMNDTYVDLDKLSFQIDRDVFNAKAHIKNISTNAQVDAVLKGTINLANLSKAYPIKLNKPLSGLLKADVSTQFDMNSVEKSQYQNIKNAGIISLSGFNYDDGKGQNMLISQALVQFNPSQVQLKQFHAKTGRSDLSLSGVLDNFYGFLFRKQELKGNFTLTSNQLVVDDFMSSAPSNAPIADNKKSGAAKKEAPLKIPAFLNCSLNAKANTVLYDNLTLKDVSGKMTIKDEKASLENLKTSVFGGSIAASGSVSTKAKTPVFDMNLHLNQVDIQQSCTQLDMMKKIAPIAGAINGKINTNIKLDGNLDAMEMTPQLQSISGDLIGQLLSSTLDPNSSNLLKALASNLKFIDLSKINLNDIKAALTFENGKVNVKPFNLKYQDIEAVVGGSHGFDQSINYQIKLNVPAKYLGKEANAYISKMSAADAAKFDNIPVTAMLTGSFANPKVSTDIKTVMTNLSMELAKQQSDKLIKKGGSELDKLISKNQKPGADTTKTNAQKEDLKKQATDVLNSLFKKKTTEQP